MNQAVSALEVDRRENLVRNIVLAKAYYTRRHKLSLGG